jgi:hypothetical protein
MGVGGWYVLNTIVLGYVLCGNVGVLYAYIILEGRQQNNQRVKYKTKKQKLQ